MILYMKISDEDGKLTSCKVPLSYVEKWPVKEENVFEEAMKKYHVDDAAKSMRIIETGSESGL